MNYKVKSIEVFKRQAKKLIKKYPSLKEEIREIIQKLKINPNLGTPIIKNCYKIRISIASKGKGKSGGARIISHFIVSQNIIYLIYIYDKNKKESISEKEIGELICKI